MVRQALITMARKNGKTELIAALALCHLCGPESELNGQIFSAAADQEQAAQVFNAAAAMVRADPELSAWVNIIDSKLRMVHYASGSFFQALSKDSKSKHGKNASVVIYDELAQARTRELYDVLRTSMGARAEPLLVVISTVSPDSTSVMSELVEYGRKVNAGVIKNPQFKAWIFQVPKDADPWDEANWFLANPALGDFRSIDEMRAEAALAQKMPGQEAAFRNLYLNQEVNAAGLLITPDVWQECERAFDLDKFRGRPCVGAIDLSGKNDLTALTLAFPDEQLVRVATWYWTPGGTMKVRGERDRVPYELWHQEGYLEVSPGKSIDYGYIAVKLGELAGKFDIRALGFDRWRIDDLIRECVDAGLEVYLSEIDDEPEDLQPGIRMIKHGQGFQDMSPAIDALETAMFNGQLKIMPNPVSTFCASNAVSVKDPAGNRKFDKVRSTGRIDGMVTMAMATRLVSLATQAGGKSFWET